MFVGWMFVFVRVLFVLHRRAPTAVGVKVKATGGVTVEREALLSCTCVCLSSGVSNPRL